eukprot:10013545-Ditylum_brightwellii.AAC.1
MLGALTTDWVETMLAIASKPQKKIEDKYASNGLHRYEGQKWKPQEIVEMQCLRPEWSSVI